jgi:hypothetical protein
MFTLDRSAFAVPESVLKHVVSQEVRCRYCGKPSEDGSGVYERCERTYERQ